ncbi:MAG: type II toxin-antitoxin system RelE/ParE family toxin [Rhodoferax sp.]|nr:type II toxin-antitoxin system RelE/ParE family toxin [Rhodoferax sp.]
MRLVWQPMALADRDTIMDYIAQDNPTAAIELDDEFEAKAEQARQRPTLYRTGRVKGTREIVVRPNYIMVYRIEDQGATLAVLRVLHAGQQWPRPSQMQR